MKTKEILEKLEELKNNDSFLSWLMNLDSNKFDDKKNY